MTGDDEMRRGLYIHSTFRAIQEALGTDARGDELIRAVKEAKACRDWLARLQKNLKACVDLSVPYVDHPERIETLKKTELTQGTYSKAA